MTAKKTVSKDDWEKKLSEVNVNKQDLNKLVMNYLVIEGYKDAVDKFSQECRLKPNVELASIQDHMKIRNTIQSGDIENAIERINDLNPDILDMNPKLYFHLQQQRLIEYIRAGKISEVLKFAQEELAPQGKENPEFLEELERTMVLLAFKDSSQSPVGDLLNHVQHQKTARELNAAILTSQSQEKDPKLLSLLKMLVYPRIKNLTTGELVMEGDAIAGNGSGSATMMTL
ncbi:CTLH/CRA C-terminal to lish motif domain-containing protein [Jimgerdemannia flammicorona]|uniref:CTLH/CRA C-terminal to lish motif domain-containing protein n=1 Tax=Jimgerdemannia flammicorona TaxID=994334 RepID=A0A433DCG5_9FUNG|nr:CTLH/CRA C-terminal to lish motif domain-containing protein [Jimgerdemannia flammicorona]